MNAQNLLNQAHKPTVSYLADVVDNPEFQKACIFAISDLEPDLIPGAKALIVQLERLSGKEVTQALKHRSLRTPTDKTE